MGKETLEIEIECVKIIGKIKGVKDNIELVMDKDVFLEWKEKIKNGN